tara:strand:+ start:6 stop:308 length:303 start_codon:yes stop_codon:yes gene_type:complete
MITTDKSKAIKSDLRTMRTVLIIFTILHFLYFVFSLMSLNSGTMNVIWTVLLVIFYINYILFIWRMPLDKFDKWRETILACIFGLIAMWAWIQFNNVEKK